MTEKRTYYRGQGKIFAYGRDQYGNPTQGRWLGNAPDFKLSMEVEKEEHKESYSGQNLVDATFIKSKKVNVSATLEEFSLDNLALCFYGTTYKKAAGSPVTLKTSSDLDVGQAVILGGAINVSNVSIKDSGNTTLTESHNYRLNAAQGSVEILNLSTNKDGNAISFKKPLNITYTPGAYSQSALFTQAESEWWIRFEGQNMLDNLTPTIVDLFKVKLDPAKEVGLISDTIAKFELNGVAMADETKMENSDIGQFGTIKML